jgi:hypothetical protein
MCCSGYRRWLSRYLLPCLGVGTALCLLRVLLVWKGIGQQHHEDARLTEVTGPVLTDLDGVSWHLSSRPAQTTCLIFLCGCHACAEFAQRLHETGLDHRPTGLIAIVTGGRDTARRIRDGTGLSCPILVDTSATITERFHALCCPHIRLMGGDGRILFANSPDQPGDPQKLTKLIVQFLRRGAEGTRRQIR